MFLRLFGVSSLAKGEYLTMWKLQEHGQARLWRLLGVLEMPSHRTTKTFISEHLREIPRSHLKPDLYFNGGVHLDPSQSATVLQNN